MLTGIWHGAGWNFLLWGLWFAVLLVLEKLFLGKLLSWLPRGIGILYTLFAVWLGWVLFSLDSPENILRFAGAMAGCGGVWDQKALFLGSEHMVLLCVAALAATPLPEGLAKRLEKSTTGMGMALYRLGEKVIPTALLLLSIAGIVEASYNPFLYFRF